MKQNLWKNRIVGYFEKPAKEFKFNPQNWRMHPQIQRDAIQSVLAEIGWITGVVENSQTGNLIDGHARIEEALVINPEMPIPFLQVDLSLEEEKKMLALLDPIGAMATTNVAAFEELISGFELQTSALLEVLAEIAVKNQIETIPLDRADNNIGEMLNSLPGLTHKTIIRYFSLYLDKWRKKNQKKTKNSALKSS